MKDMTFGTFLCCLFLAFTLGFLACHKIYKNSEEKHVFNKLWRNNPSLYIKRF